VLAGGCASIPASPRWSRSSSACRP
jgi:hypothetical protein